MKLWRIFDSVGLIAYKERRVMMLGLEKPRKDFRELVAHHIVTLALIGLSYRFHFTYIGIAVYITHDVSDFFLAVSLLE